jgi:hypothetical protein
MLYGELSPAWISAYQKYKKQYDMKGYTVKEGHEICIPGESLPQFKKELLEKIDEYSKTSVSEFLRSGQEGEFDEKYQTKDEVIRDIRALIDKNEEPYVGVVYWNGRRLTGDNASSLQDRWSHALVYLKYAAINDLYRPVTPEAPPAPTIQITASGNVIFVKPLE